MTVRANILKTTVATKALARSLLREDKAEACLSCFTCGFVAGIREYNPYVVWSYISY